MSKVYAVLGSGMQGTAAAYDLAKFGDSSEIRLGDLDLHQSQAACDKVNRLVGDIKCEPHEVDALDTASLKSFLENVDCLISCTPYWMHPHIAKVAVEVGCNMVDLGGNTDITMQTLALDDKAKEAGITLVPDTGLAPGLVNSIGLYLIEQLDDCESVQLYCGVLPQNPVPPLNYKLTFNVEGLVTEYDYEAICLMDGEIVKRPTLDDLETLEIDQLGTMEAFNTSGGTSTAPYTFKDRVNSYVYKTIRHPGHCQLIKMFKDFGFWNEEEVDVKGTKIVPKDVFNAVFGPELEKFEDVDLCVVRGVGVGTKGGQKQRIQVDIFDKEDEEKGFTSMERLTGFSASIYAIAAANGKMDPGALRYEEAYSGGAFLDELKKRGISIAESQQHA